jgi:hypothetical protein
MVGFGAVAQEAVKRQKAESKRQKENREIGVVKTFLLSAFCFLPFISFL